MNDLERGLLRKYFDGYRMFAEINGRSLELLYASHGEDDPLPWIWHADPAVRFPSAMVQAVPSRCKVCRHPTPLLRNARRDVGPMDVCVDHAVAELAGDIVQIEKGTLK
jgi:hypothetical protein